SGPNRTTREELTRGSEELRESFDQTATREARKNSPRISHEGVSFCGSRVDTATLVNRFEDRKVPTCRRSVDDVFTTAQKCGNFIALRSSRTIDLSTLSQSRSIGKERGTDFRRDVIPHTLNTV